MDRTDGEGLPRLRAGPRFRRREVEVDAGGWTPYVAADWCGALVVVERGEIELHCTRGSMRRFGTGSILCFDGLALRALHNPGTGPAVLVALSRRGG